MPAELAADQVLVTVGTPCTMSAAGGTETTRARVREAPEWWVFAAFDAGLVDIDVEGAGTVTARWPDGTRAEPRDIEHRYGTQLRDAMGIRVVPDLHDRGAPVDIAAALPHDLADGGLRRLAGLTYTDIRGSELRDMHGLFNDDPRLGPSLQAQLFSYAGLVSLAALPGPLSQLVEEPFDFRVVAASAFSGLDAFTELHDPGSGNGTRDKFAARLASSLASHGGALVSTMLAPSYPIGKTTKNPSVLASLESSTGRMRVPQSPLNVAGACAAGLIALSELAPQLLVDLPGRRRPQMMLWGAADAATRPAWQVLDGFGPNALVTTAKVADLNADRPLSEQRAVADSLAPFDVDACGTVIGDGGSAVMVTTLDFALRNFLDVTSIIVGWGQSSETGGKAHFAGVGFGGENAIIEAFDMARLAHGYGVSDFGYLAAHATGTRTNSKTDLTAAATARRVAAHSAGVTGPLPAMAVGTPKALGDGHTMGETGLKAVAHAIDHLLGEPTVGLPTLRRVDPELGDLVEQFDLARGPIPGNEDGAAICATQGFGGYNGAVALRSATPDTLTRYRCDPSTLAAYLERWPAVRRERELRERRARTTRGAALELALEHRWTNGS